MFFSKSNKRFGFFGRFLKWFEDRKISRKVHKGIVPIGYTVARIAEALKATKPVGSMEAWGFCSARAFNPDGTLKRDYGLQSVKEISDEFVSWFVDCLGDSTVVMSDFDKHAMGAGSTAETPGETALVDQEPTRETGLQSVGATSNLYETIATITANTAFGCREHGIFDSTSAGSDIMLDRSRVTNITLITDDEVEWTYTLTVDAGG